MSKASNREYLTLSEAFDSRRVRGISNRAYGRKRSMNEEMTNQAPVETEDYVADSVDWSTDGLADFDSFLDDLKSEFEEMPVSEPTTEVVTDVAEPEVALNDEVDEHTEVEADTSMVEPSVVEEVQQEATQDIPKFEQPKQNEAFKTMRLQMEEAQRQAKSNEQYKMFLEELAHQSGQTPEQLMESTRQIMLKRQAEQQNIPVDVLQRIQAQEKELAQFKEQSQAQVFNQNMGALVSKLQLKEDEVKQFFADAQAQNIDLRQVPNLEMVYKGLYADVLIEKARQEAVQKQLADKRRRQEQANVVPTNSAPANIQGFSDRDIDLALAKFGLDPRDYQ